MSLARAETVTVHPVSSGGVFFVAAAQQAEVRVDLRSRHYLVATASTPERGRLRQAIEDAVEGALALRGASPPRLCGSPWGEATVQDQVGRAEGLGAAGLVMALPPLSGLLDGAGQLGAEDSAVLLAWMDAAQKEPLVLVLDEGDRDIRVLLPTRLGDLASRLPGESDVPPSGEVEKAALLAPALPVIEAPKVVEESAEAEDEAPTQRLPSRPVAMAPPAPRSPEGASRRGVLKKRSSTSKAKPVMSAAAALLAEESAGNEIVPPPPSVERADEALSPSLEQATRRIVNAAEWRAHAVALDNARGPKPVSVIERLFVGHYVPLLGAVARGEVDGSVRGVVDTWRSNFEHSYKDAFAALRVTGKRPSMVFDAPDVAGRLSRLNGARATKLLLVDAMRYDLGERVGQILGDRLSGRAVCVDRPVLWSALPTTTPTQMALLARGADGLRELELGGEAGPEPEIMRGRALGKLRRDRVGSREVMKLDLVEGRLRTAGPGFEERISGLAEEVADIVLRYMESLPPRTLVFLFGDHGFRLPVSPDGRSTGAASQGGLSPEEVLVPGQAWLLGDMH